MILFVFEGTEREICLFRTMESLFFSKKKERIICSFGNNIYQLYDRMTSDGEEFAIDILTALQERDLPENEIDIAKVKRSEISEVFLFFDYDIHNQNYLQNLTIEEKNQKLGKMLSFFNDETNNGKLYISYPMIEAIRYTKKLPDEDYINYQVPIDNVGEFKEEADRFSYYKNLDFIAFRMNSQKCVKAPSPDKKEVIKQNWIFTIILNVKKAFFLCDEDFDSSKNKETIAPVNIFNAQIHLCETKHNVAVLCSYPLFLFDYFDKPLIREL